MELERNLRTDLVLHLEPTPPRNIGVHATVGEAVELMRRDKVGCVLVCDDGPLVGVFTERDVLCRVITPNRSMQTRVAEVMTRDPVTVRPKDTIRVAIRRMQQGGYRHLPVIDAQQKPIGILSVKRIIHYLVEHYPAAVYNLPPDPRLIPQAREGA